MHAFIAAAALAAIAFPRTPGSAHRPGPPAQQPPAAVATDATRPMEPAAGRFWWERGHHLVAALAWERLTPEARSAAQELLGDANFIEVSVWADSIRPFRRESAPWHYVNVPIDGEGYDPALHCPGGQCVVAAIEWFDQVLRDPAAPSGVRGEALRYLIHFVGDLHQPMHAGDNRDRGGNDQRVVVNGRETNLHAVWDGLVVEALAPTEALLLARLQDRLARTPADTLAGWTGVPVVEWAREGWRTSRDHAYRLPADGIIGAEYLDAQGDRVELALLKAGVRLADLLNRALPR